MNAIHFLQPTPATARPTTQRVDALLLQATMPTRHVHRERAFGVGYGNSSGYASARRYAEQREPPRFRCL